MQSRNFKWLPTVYYGSFKIQPEDGFMTTETCSCCVILINCILFYNKVVLGH